MGEVSLARYRKDGMYVAVKAVSKGYVAKHKDERHLRNERDILARLRHPFVVRLFGTFQDTRRVYFVLEYVAGGELFAKLRGHRCLGPNAATFYLSEILAALAHVHASGYAYRDTTQSTRALCGVGSHFLGTSLQHHGRLFADFFRPTAGSVSQTPQASKPQSFSATSILRDASARWTLGNRHAAARRSP